MSGKKGKKTKGKTMNLQDFLGDTPGVVTVPKIKSWADCTEDDDEYGYVSRKNDVPVVLPTAPRAARDQSINEENIPTSPPFVAYISNLPYDVDEQDLAEFFQDMKVHSMRLPKDANKFKGYGYVEFEDRQSLINALSMVDTNLKNRRVRIEVSNSSNDERRGRMGRMGERRDYMDDPERTTGDWRSARSNDDGPDDGGGGRDDRYRSRGGFDRRDDDRSGGGFEDSKPGNWRDGPRDMAAMDRPRPTFRDSRPGPGDDRGGERDWNRFADRGRGNRDRSRELDGDRGGGSSSFGPRRTFGDDADRDRERWSSVRSQPRDNLDGPPPSSDAPRTRPTLNLKPRTKPIENAPPPSKVDSEGASNEDGDRPSSAASNSAPAPTPVPAVNIFGAAKPVDTAAREREIEERLAKSAEARLKEKDSDRRAPRETWGRRNGEGRDDDSRSRPTWRSSESRGTFDRSEGRQPLSRDNRDQRDYKDHRESGEPQDAGEPRETVEPRSDSRGSSANRGAAPPPARGPPKQVDSRPPPDGAEREKKKEEDEISRMPKAKDDQAPNFVASNKYSMLPDDVDPDNIDNIEE